MTGGGGRVAIIGHACRLPGGATDPDKFWDLLLAGADAVTTLPPDRFELDRFLHPEVGQRGKTYTFAAGTIGDVAGFDAAFFGISAREAGQMDPQQRLLLELAWEALERAGQIPSRLAGSDCAVYVGISGSDYAERRMGDLESTDPYFMLGATLSIAANRISYALDLRGPSMAVDTACSSSLVAMNEAVQTLQAGRAGMALVGGVNLLLSPAPFVGFASAGMLSRDGRCRAFGQAGEGYVRSEGGGVVVLKRLADAERDGDPILAVVEGVGVNSDGRTHGISLPSSKAQEALLRRVYRQARIAPREVSYFEAHGTGTRVGDPAEASAIGAAVGVKRPKSAPLLIGSAKSNVGHLEPAAGMVGLIKAIEILRHGVVPPSLHLDALNPDIPFEGLNLRPVRAATPLPDRHHAVVGVNSFGFGGANAHAILRAYEPRKGAVAAPPSSGSLPFVVSGRTEAALAAAVEDMGGFLARQEASAHEACAWRDIAYTACCRRAHHTHRLIVHASSLAEAREALRRPDGGGRPNPAGAGGGSNARTALVFVGNGSQWDGMGRQLLAEDAVFRDAVARLDSVARWRLGWSPLHQMEAGAGRMDDTRIAQPMLFALQVGLVESLRARGLKFDAVVGHSVGEVAAAYISGALGLEQAVELVKTRSDAQGRTRAEGRMLAASMSLEDAVAEIAPYGGAVELAAVNSPRAVTLAGNGAALQQIHDALERRGVASRLLDLDYAFHSATQDAIREEVMHGFASLAPRPTTLPFYSTVTGALAEGPELGADYWWRNIRDRVRFGDAVSAMAADGVRIFLEVGPQPQLQGYIRHSLAQAKTPGQSIATLSKAEPGAVAVEHGLDRAFVAGAEIDFSPAFPEGGAVAPLPTYPWRRERHWYDPSPEAGLSFNSRTEGGLLGLRVAPNVNVWERQVDVGCLPWLADHVLDGAVVVPAAAYVEMALEAGALLLPAKPVEIEAMEIHRPMLLEERASLMVRLAWSASDHIFTIESRPRLQPSGWIVNVTGRLSAAGAFPHAPDTAAMDEDAALITREAHYAFTEARGFSYGPAFAVLQQARATADRAQATLALDASAAQAPYRLHPALLDGMMQTVFPILRARMGGEASAEAMAFVPSKIGRLAFAGTGPGPYGVEVALVGGSRRTVTANGRLRDASGAVVAEVTGLRLTSISLGRPRAPKAAVLQTCIEPLAPRRDTPPPAAAMKAARAAFAKAAAGSSIEPLRRRLDSIAAGAAADALIGLGEEVVPAERQGRLARLIEMIEADADPALDWEAAWRDALQAHPELLAELTLLGRGGRTLTDVLRGRDPPEPGAAVLQQLFDGSPLFAPARRGLVAAVDRFARVWPADRRLRVLVLAPPPVAADLVAVLPTGRCDVTVADVGAADAWIERAASAERNDVRTLACDLADPESLPLHAFDLVAGAHVLRDAANPSVALETFARTLATGAALLLAEGAPSAWAEVALPGKLDSDPRLEARLKAAGLRDVELKPCGAARLIRAAAPPSPLEALASTRRYWMVLAGPEEATVANGLCDALVRRGQHVSRLDAGEQDWLDRTAWAAQIRELGLGGEAPAGLVHLAGMESSPASADEVLALQDARCLTLLAAVQGLGETALARFALRLVTRSAYAAPGGGPVEPAQAALVGLGRVVQNERPDMDCRIIDVQRRHAALQLFIDDLADEILESSREAEVVLRGRARFAPRLRPVTRPPPPIGEDKMEALQSPGGGLDNLRWTQAPRRALDPDEVEVEVRAGGLNFRDVMFAMGALPDEILESGFVGPSLGMEAAGVVSRVGAGVSDLAPGDRVACFARASLATHTVTRSFAVAKLPEGVGFVEGATLITAFFTVTYALKRLAQLCPGERVLIHGGAGGVGMAAIQYARHCGAEVFATAGTEEKRETVRLLGVDDDHVLDSRSNDFADHIRALTGGEGVDVVLNSIAGEAVHRGLSLLRPFGRFLELGKIDFVANSRIGLRVFRNNIAYHGVDADELMARKPELSRQILAETLELLRQGAYTPLPYRVFPRERIVEAFRHMQRSRHMGKIVVDMHTAPGAAAAEPPRTRPIAIDPGAAYLITGGLGGLGLAAARWLAAKGARHLVLASRSGTGSAEAQGALSDLRGLGVRVDTPQCDIADAAAVAALFAGLQAGGSPLKGVIHAAAVFDDALIEAQTPERFRSVLAPKLAGGWALHQASAGCDLDMFVCISSISAVIGNPGQSNYAAANLFLEALVALRQSLGLPGQVLALGPVADAGYLAERGALRDVFARMGIRPLSAGEVFERLDQICLGHGAGELLADVKWPRLATVLPAVRSPRFNALAVHGQEEEPLALATDLSAMVNTMPPEEVLEVLQATLVQLVAQILHVTPDKIDRERSVFELGMDSLMGLELKMSIEEKLGVAVPPMLLSQDVGVRRIAELIRDQLLGAETSEAAEAPAAGASEQAYLQARHAENLDERMISEAMEAVNARGAVRLIP